MAAQSPPRRRRLRHLGRRGSRRDLGRRHVGFGGRPVPLDLFGRGHLVEVEGHVLGRLRAPHRRDDHGVVVGQRDLFGRDRRCGLAGGRQVEGPGLALTGLHRLVQRAVALLVVGQHRVLERLLVGLPVGVLLPPGGPGHRRPRVGALALVGPAPGEHRGHLAGRGLGPVGQLGPAGLDGGGVLGRPAVGRPGGIRLFVAGSEQGPGGLRADDPHPPGDRWRRLLFCVVLVVHLTPLRPRAAPSPCGTGAARPQPPAGG